MPEWNELFKERRNRWVNPYEDVTSFFKKIPSQDHPLVLDLGSGTGRHLRYLEKLSFRPVGMDISGNGLLISQKSLQKNWYPFRLVQADMSDSLPFADECFDYIISIHVIFHNPRKAVENTLKEIYRVLKPNGEAIVTFNSVYSYRFGKGIEIEPGTWIPDIGADEGIPHHFSDLLDLVELLRDFKVLSIRLAESEEEGRISSHWVTTFRKCDQREQR